VDSPPPPQHELIQIVEAAGPAFNPAGNRLYFSSQRGTSGDSLGTGGITYEATGPFRGAG
jgi:hypothetical protein